MKHARTISVVAFVVIFFSALFLFIRNYPSDKEFSFVFVVAGGVLVWCAWGSYQEESGTTTATTTEQK